MKLILTWRLDRSDIWTPKSIMGSERVNRSRLGGFDKDFGSKIEVNTMTSFITQSENVFLNKTNYSNGNNFFLSA